MNNLRKQLENFIPFNEQEEVDKQAFLNFFDSFEDVLTRNNVIGHLSASAFVVTEDFSQALVVYHNIFDGLIYPGGHADGDANLYEVALRETKEETGLNVEPVIDKNIFAIQALPIAGHIKKGKYVSSHTHFDVVYLMKAKDIDKDNLKIAEAENSEVKWIDLHDTYSDDAVWFIKPIQKKIVDKIESLDLVKN